MEQKEKTPQSEKEQRIRKITHLYYSRPDVQKVLFEFSKNREICPRYFEGFGKRPDSFQYPSDIFELVKKGATSFHCSEELWKDPLEVSTGMNEKQMNELRTGWDFLIDIDSKYIDYSKISAELIIEFLEFYKIKNVGVKFSGSKGLHIIIPWKAFPKEINGEETKNMFPELARILIRYIIEQTKEKLIEKISELSKPNRYVKDFKAPKEVMPDIILVSPRHLFRMPYSLHEKTALVSIVIDKDKIRDFELKDADPLKIKIKNFMPDAKDGEAAGLLREALDWYREKNPEKSEEKKSRDYKPIKIDALSERNFPPCIQKILAGVSDGRKRAVFALINFFRSLGIEKKEVEERVYEWNKKNESPLKEGYIRSQISWSYKGSPILPPNCKEFYQGIAVCLPDDFCKIVKNPVNYTAKKSFSFENNKKKKRGRTNNFKNKD